LITTREPHNFDDTPESPDNKQRMATRSGIYVRHWRKLLTQLVVVLAVVAVALARWDGGAAFFLGLLAASLVGLVDGRVSIGMGLLAVAACPLLLIANREAWLQQSTFVNYYFANVGLYDAGVAADLVAVWAYYLLCIGVVAQIVRYFVTGKRRQK